MIMLIEKSKGEASTFFARAGKFSWHFLQSCHMAGLDETGRLYVGNI